MAKAKSAAIQISRKGMFVWVGLFLFVAAWMFVLGIMVGRGIAPVDLEKDKLGQELADLKAKILQQEQAKVEKQVSGQEGGKPQLGFYEALKDPGERKPAKPVAKPKTKPRPKPQVGAKRIPVPKPVPKPAAKPVPKPVAKPVAKPIPKPVPKPLAKPATKPVAKPAPVPAKPDAAKGRFAIQVAAVKDVQRAAQLVAQLRKKGFRAYQIRSEVAGKGVWYRVRVGAYESRDAAGSTLKKLESGGYPSMVIGTR